VATGNQDNTIRIFDIRNTSKSLVTLPSVFSAIRSLKFTEDGTFLIAAEAADFVHIFDVRHGFAQTSSSSSLSSSQPRPGHAKGRDRLICGQLVKAETNEIRDKDGAAVGRVWSNKLFQSQVIDFFGEISGVGVSPGDGEFMYIGNSGAVFLLLNFCISFLNLFFLDDKYGCLLEFHRKGESMGMNEYF
jgi:hypothetical protein